MITQFLNTRYWIFLFFLSGTLSAAPSASVNPTLSVHEFVKQNNSANLDRFLQQNPECLNEQDQLGQTPLIVATRYNLTEIADQLLNQEADYHLCDCWEYTPLHHAIEKVNVGLVKRLLACKANANAQTCNGDTPLHLAVINYSYYYRKPSIKNDLLAIITLLKQHNAKITVGEIYNRWTPLTIIQHLSLPPAEQEILIKAITT